MPRRSAALLAALFLLLPFAAPAKGADVPQVDVWSPEQTARIGERIWRQDVAAARATDILLAQSHGRPPEGLIGWIVVDEGEAQRVRFLAGDEAAPRAMFDVMVSADLRAGPLEAAEGALPPEQATAFQARTTAANAMGPLRCAAHYNSVVLKDPEGDGWLVWLLAATTKAGMIPMGGHYRFHISADGQAVVKREQLSAGCMDIDGGKTPKGGKIEATMTTVVVAPQPLEIHVFLSLLNRLPIFVMAGDRLWLVEGAHIRSVD